MVGSNELTRTESFQAIHLLGPAPKTGEFSCSSLIGRIFARCGLAEGRCFGSKSAYRNSKRKSQAHFNANIFSSSGRKLWWGDLDLATDKSKLEAAAHRLRRRLYVLSESEGRFENSLLSRYQVLRRAIWHTGGPTIPIGISGALNVAGITRRQYQRIFGFSKKRIFGRNSPERNRKLWEHISSFESVFSLMPPPSAGMRWGRWMLTPNKSLGGMTPAEHLRKTKNLSLGELLLAEAEDVVAPPTT